MNGRWKEGGLIIELFKTIRSSTKFDRMIESGSSWLMEIKVQGIIGQAHAVIEPGRRFQCGNSIKSQDTQVNTC